jgi:PAS domain S-box-containing protein
MTNMHTTERPNAPITDASVRILLVSDADAQREQIIALLEQSTLSYALTTVDANVGAVQQLQRASHDVVLMVDQLRPIPFLQVLTREGMTVPVIFLGACDGLADEMAILKAGAADVVPLAGLTSAVLVRSISTSQARAAALVELQTNEARYRGIVEGQAEFLIRYDNSLNLTFVNHAYCAYRGEPTAALLGTSALATVLTADRERLKGAVRGLSASWPSMSIEVQTTDSTEKPHRWHHWTVQAIYDEDEGLLAFQSVIRDVTERKYVEAALNSRLEELNVLRRVDAELTETLNMTSVATLALDSAMRLSGAHIALLGMYSEESGELKLREAYGVEMESVEPIFAEKHGIIGQVIQERQARLIPDIATEPDATATDPRMTTQMLIPLISQERMLGLISLETYLPERFSPERFEFLQLVTGRIAVALDNARLYELQRQQLEELQQLYEQVTQLEQLKTDMIRIASHDLRNPIGVMQGYIEMLEWDVSNENHDTKRYLDQLEAMQRMTRRMRKITADILSVDRIEQSALPNQDITLDLTQIIREAAEEHVHAAKQKGIDYRIKLPPLPTEIHGDAAQLHEAADNLIGNAIKYTPEGGRVVVTLEYDGDAAVVEVRDNGYGIPYEMQARLFEPFYRVRTKETTSIEGTGLGLHLVKNIIERHRGRMIFRSRYREGSTFGFQIPTRFDEED